MRQVVEVGAVRPSGTGGRAQLRADSWLRQMLTATDVDAVKEIVETKIAGSG